MQSPSSKCPALQITKLINNRYLRFANSQNCGKGGEVTELQYLHPTLTAFEKPPDNTVGGPTHTGYILPSCL